MITLIRGCTGIYYISFLTLNPDEQHRKDKSTLLFTQPSRYAGSLFNVFVSAILAAISQNGRVNALEYLLLSAKTK